MVLNRVGSPLRDNLSKHRNDPDVLPLLAGEIQSEATAKAVEHPPEPKVGAPVPDPTDSSDPPRDYTGRVMDELIANAGPEDKGDGIKTRVGMSRKLKSGSGQIPHPDYYQKS
jgi:hypothetical protein